MNPYPSSDAALDDLMAPWNRSDAPGGVLAISHRGKLWAHRAVGLANVETGTVLQAGSRFPIGSITKQFTCAALLLLEADGVLSLADLVGRWLPDLPPAQRAPNLHQLMTHSGGVRCYLDQWMFDGYRTMPLGTPWSVQSRQSTANFPPGEGSSYSNGGYLLLTRVVERASGLPLGRFLAERIFAPLGMFATSLPSPDGSREVGEINTYMRADKPTSTTGWQLALAMTEERFGDGGMVSTAGDLLRWASYLRHSAGPVRLERMAPPSGPNDGTGYGLGLIGQRWRGCRLIQHAGGLPGANSALLTLPDEALDIVVLFNCSAPATDIALRSAEIVLGEGLPPAPAHPDARNHGGLLGQYVARETGLLFGFSDVDGVLSLSLFGDAPFPLEGRARQGAELPFWADVGTGDMRFRLSAHSMTEAPAGAVDYFDGKRWYRAERVEEMSCGIEEFLARVPCTFRCDEADAVLDFEERSGELVIRIRGQHGNGCYRADILSPDLVRFWPSQFPSSKLARLIRSGSGVASVVISTSRTRATTFTREGAV
ncbi:serine hydrolase domain-containing protein [Rhodanobacter sp. UC4436_H3]